MNRRSRLLTFSIMACLPVAGLIAAAIPAANAANLARPASHSASARTHALMLARDFLRHLKVGQHAANHSVGVLRPAISGLSQVQSTNWSGYADNNSGGHTYSSVAASWTEPSGSCSGFTTSLAAFWVGIDGYSSGSVEQDGTLIECYFGSAYYFTWWEMYPTNAIQVVGDTLRPGDHISASVVRSGSTYTLKVTDSSRSGDSFTKTESCSGCANSSAEWIAEAPSGSSGVYPLTDFGTWTASGATVSANTGSGVISTFPDDEITMVDSSGSVKAQPGSLNGSGNGFSVSWKRSS